jgi:rhodanese-related sulfurtransferase
MVATVDTDRVRQLAAAGAQLVEVLPASEYDEQHLPGAIHLPLKELRADTVGGLDPARPVVVYCFDFQ